MDSESRAASPSPDGLREYVSRVVAMLDELPTITDETDDDEAKWDEFHRYLEGL